MDEDQRIYNMNIIADLLAEKVDRIPFDATWDSESLGQPTLDGENLRECFLAFIQQTIRIEGAEWLLEFAEV
jgi:hypothetical protein